MKKLLLLCLAIVTGMVNANADGEMWLRSDLNGGSWTENKNDFLFNKTWDAPNSQDIYELTIDGAKLKENTDFHFRLYRNGTDYEVCPYVPDGSYTYKFENGQNETYNAIGDNFKGTTYSFGVAHSSIKANSYKITVYVKYNNPWEYYIKVEIVNMPVKITSVGYATFSSNYALDFSGKDIIPCSATVSNGKITYTQQTTVPAGEGVLLKREDGQLAEATAIVPVIEKNQATPFNENHFVAIPEKTQLAQSTEEGYTNYILSMVNDEIGFYKVNSAGSWVNGGTAYLKVHTGTESARTSFPLVDEAATSIESIHASQNDSPIFNLAGQQVAQPTKGLYIVNGKKVIIK